MTEAQRIEKRIRHLEAVVAACRQHGGDATEVEEQIADLRARLRSADHRERRPAPPGERRA